MRIVILFLINLCFVTTAFSAPIKVYISEPNIVGSSNDVKEAIATLLKNNLNKSSILTVNEQEEADVIVTPTYVLIGSQYSLNALSKNYTGKLISNTFVQGDNKEPVISSIVKLADKLAVDIPANYIQPKEPKPIKSKTPKSSEFITKSSKNFFVNSKDGQGISAGWQSRRLDGSYNLFAIPSPQADGSRNIVIANDNQVRLFTYNQEMKQLDGFVLNALAKVMSVDILKQNGTDYLFISVIREENVSSEIWEIKDNKFTKVADNISLLFKVIFVGGEQKLCAQALGVSQEPFFGPIIEMKFDGKKIKNISTPRYANIFSFTQFKDVAGNLYTLTYSTDNYLVVFDSSEKEVWRSQDKYGGSELYFLREHSNVLENSGKYKYYFVNQRINTTQNGDILVVKNDGFWVMTASRSYSRGAIIGLSWTAAAFMMSLKMN